MIRVSQRIGLTKSGEADKIEADLRRLVPIPRWTDFPSS